MYSFTLLVFIYFPSSNLFSTCFCNGVFNFISPLSISITHAILILKGGEYMKIDFSKIDAIARAHALTIQTGNDVPSAITAAIVEALKEYHKQLNKN